MPYRRRYGRKKKYGRKRRYRKKTSSGSLVWNTAKKAARSIMKYYLNPESKYFDVSANGVAVTAATGVLNLLTQIPQGDGASNRDGSQIRLQRIDVRVSIENGSTTGINQLVRTIMFYDTQKNVGSNPVSADLLQDPSNVRSPLNFNYRGRFTVIHDRITPVVGGQANEVVSFGIRKALHHHVMWDDTGANAATNLRDGHVFLLFLTDAIAAQPLFSFYSRTRYLDN